MLGSYYQTRFSQAIQGLGAEASLAEEALSKLLPAASNTVLDWAAQESDTTWRQVVPEFAIQMWRITDAAMASVKAVSYGADLPFVAIWLHQTADVFLS